MTQAAQPVAPTPIPVAHKAPPPETVEAPTEAPRSYGRRTSGAKPTAPTAYAGPERHCLLVDDSRMIRKVARQIVEARGYKVAEAENGQEALDKCQMAMPDLIILDWDMPIMTGIEFLAALRALDVPQQPKVVFCTTKSGAMEIHRGIDVGADEYVTKPFDQASLLAKLENIDAA